MLLVHDQGSVEEALLPFPLVLGSWLALTATKVSSTFIASLLIHSSSKWPVGNLEAECLAVAPIQEPLLWARYFT